MEDQEVVREKRALTEDEIIEERRKRREAILSKYQTTAPNLGTTEHLSFSLSLGMRIRSSFLAFYDTVAQSQSLQSNDKNSNIDSVSARAIEPKSYQPHQDTSLLENKNSHGPGHQQNVNEQQNAKEIENEKDDEEDDDMFSENFQEKSTRAS